LGHRQRFFSSMVLITTDMLSLVFSVWISHGFRLWLDRFAYFSDYDGQWSRFLFSGLLFVLLLLIFYSLGLYTRRNDFWEETRKIFLALFYLFVFIAAFVFLTKSSEQYSRAMIVLMLFNAAWLLPLGRVLAKKMLTKLGIWQKPALIVGEPEQVEHLKNQLRLNWYLGYVPTDEADKEGVVFISTRGMPVEELERLIGTYKKRFEDVIVIPYLHHLSFANAEIIDLRIGQVSMINIQNQLFRKKNILLKEIAEMAAIIAILPIFALLYVLIAVWIKTDSRGPVLYRQKRLGRGGRVFECYKFRTMYVDNRHLLDKYLKAHPEEVEYYHRYHKYRNDPRITGAGKWLRKFSLDELPQILNILKGEMSLIGPRPYMVEERRKLGEAAETILHVRPGITGFWQIKGRNDLTFAERVELDVWYIQNWSLWLDFIIFVKTFEVLATRRGAR
jgi:exopolysaccharide biosynthesis polyprenyl glycosylphosphotransferase